MLLFLREVLHIRFRSALPIAGLGIGSTFGISEHDGRVTTNGELLLEGRILLEHRRGQAGLVPGIIDFHQNVEILHPIGELLVIEDLLLELLAPPAPIRTGEIKEEIFLFLGSQLLGSREVGVPARGSLHRGRERDGGQGRCDQCFHSKFEVPLESDAEAAIRVPSSEIRPGGTLFANRPLLSPIGTIDDLIVTIDKPKGTTSG